MRWAGVILGLAFLSGAIRQLAPNGIHWIGHWPTSSTTAEDAYRVMATPGDPAFINLPDAIALHEKKSAVFLDARTSGEFAKGHIPGARNLPFYDFETARAHVLAGLAFETPLVVYCEGVGCELSLLLARSLQKAGYHSIRVFYGGYPEWKAAGLGVDQ